jgi:hypothetical protein
MTAPIKPGAMFLFGETEQDARDHSKYAHHICNEVEVEEPYKGTMRRRWKAKSDKTHFLDASYYSDVAANMEGIKLLSQRSRHSNRSTFEPVRYGSGSIDRTALNTKMAKAACIMDEPKPRPTLGEYAAAANGAPTCPGCGCVLFVNKTVTRATTILRYERCRNPACGRRFETRQPHRGIVREIE